jgi:hypothetical protein
LRDAAAGQQTRSSQLPESCFRYLLSHPAMDVEHVRFLQNLMFRIDDPRDQVAVIRMAKAMYALYADVLGSLPHFPA